MLFATVVNHVVFKSRLNEGPQGIKTMSATEYAYVQISQNCPIHPPDYFRLRQIIKFDNTLFWMYEITFVSFNFFFLQKQLALEYTLLNDWDYIPEFKIFLKK